jgi:ribosomal protein S18 acetylase RimI-like enzyme
MSVQVKLAKTNLTHQDLKYKVYRIDYNRVLDKISIDGLPNIEFPFEEFTKELREFFRSEARFSANQAMKAVSSKIGEFAKEKVESNQLYCSFDKDYNITCFCMIVPSEKLSDTYWINLIGTPKKYRGQGYATNIIKFAENKAIEDNKSRLHIVVYADNKNAFRLYTSLGFEEVTRGDMSEYIKENAFTKAMYKPEFYKSRNAIYKSLPDSWTDYEKAIHMSRNYPGSISDLTRTGKYTSLGFGMGFVPGAIAAGVKTNGESTAAILGGGLGGAVIGTGLGYLGAKAVDAIANKRKKKDMSEKFDPNKEYEVIYEPRAVKGSQMARIGAALLPAGLGALIAGHLSNKNPKAMLISGLASGALTYLANPHLSHNHIEQVPVFIEKEKKDMSDGASYVTYMNRKRNFEPTDFENENFGWRYFGKATDALQGATGLSRDKALGLTGAGIGALTATLLKSGPLSNPTAFAVGAGAGALGLMGANYLKRKYDNAVNRRAAEIEYYKDLQRSMQRNKGKKHGATR